MLYTRCTPATISAVIAYPLHMQNLLCVDVSHANTCDFASRTRNMLMRQQTGFGYGQLLNKHKLCVQALSMSDTTLWL